MSRQNIKNKNKQNKEMKKLDLVKQEKLINETLNVVEADSNR